MCEEIYVVIDVTNNIKLKDRELPVEAKRLFQKRKLVRLFYCVLKIANFLLT